MKKKMSILGALLLAVVVTGYSVSGTYAKYTEDFTAAQTSASVAKWDIKLLDKDGQDVTENFKFDLFANATNSSLGVTTDGDKNIIAPGSTGSFKIKVKNDSDVNATYSATFTIGGAAVPLQFKLNGATEWSTSLSAVSSTAINAGAEGEITVEWQWPYEVDAAGNTADTALGTTSATGDNRSTVTVDATVTVTQATVA